MPTPDKCPSCGTKVPPGARDCPGCPQSFAEEEGVLDYKQRKGKDHSTLLLIAAACILFLVVAFKVLTRVMQMGAQELEQKPGAAAASAGPVSQAQRVQAMAAAQSAEGDAQKLALVVAAGATGSTTAGAAAAHSAAAAAAAPQEALGSPEIVIEQSPPPSMKRKRRRGSAPAADGQWRLRGRLFDLVTLEPMTGVTMLLKDIELERRVETVTDQDGRYSVTLPPLNGHGYSVGFDYPGYAPTALTDTGSVPFKQQSVEERKQTARELARTVTSNLTIEGNGDAPTVTDFYLAPKN